MCEIAGEGVANSAQSSPASGAGERGFEALSDDDVFDLLANRQRRIVLWHFRDSAGPVSVAELAASVAARRNTDGGETDRAGETDAAISLHHVHLPKLADAGIVEYDAAAKNVKLIADLSALEARCGPYWRLDIGEE